MLKFYQCLYVVLFRTYLKVGIYPLDLALKHFRLCVYLISYNLTRAYL